MWVLVPGPSVVTELELVTRYSSIVSLLLATTRGFYQVRVLVVATTYRSNQSAAVASRYCYGTRTSTRTRS
eukprot:scaffold194443_cov22-Prasinocladus_malaysianus.AAC.1